MAKYAVWLSGLVTYAEVAMILNTIGEIPISASRVWRRVAVWEPPCQAVEATQRATSLVTPTREELNGPATPTPDLGAAMDGGLRRGSVGGCLQTISSPFGRLGHALGPA